MNFFGEAFRNCCMLLVGYTGFKSSWLALWLQTLGTEITGFPLTLNSIPSHWNLLTLKYTRACQQLEWKPIWSFEESLSATAQWYKANIDSKTVISEKQISDYSVAAKQAGLAWGCK